MQLEVDGPCARPVPPGALQDGRESGVERLETKDDEGTLIGVVPGAEGKVWLDPANLLVQS